MTPGLAKAPVRVIDRHATVAALVMAVLAPTSLVLALFWGEWNDVSSTVAIVAVLISVFLFATLRLILLPAAYRRPVRARWLMALITVLSLLALAAVPHFRGVSAVGAGLLAARTLVSLSLFLIVEVSARSS